MPSNKIGFYTPVFRRWCLHVRQSQFSALFSWHALTYSAEILYVILFLLTSDQDWVSLISISLTLDIEVLLPVKFRLILYSGFRGEVENVSANQRPRRPSLFLRSARETKSWGGRWDLASFQGSLNSFQQFQRRSRKCKKLMPDDRRRTTWDHNSALEPSAQVY